MKKEASLHYVVNGLACEFHPGTLALKQLSCGRRVWLDNGATGAALWQLHLADAQGRRVDLDGSAASSASARMKGSTLLLEWRGVKDATSGAGSFDVTVTIAPAEESGLTAWRLKVKNRSKGWTIWHLLFPRLSGLVPSKKPAADRVFWPELWGMQATGWEAMTEISGPCGGYGRHAMQFIGFTRDARTLYLGAHDAAQWPKQMVFNPGKATDAPRRAALHFLAHPAGMTEPGNSYAQDYDIVLGELAGDWFDSAKVYAGFARNQAWASTPPTNAFHGPREEREVLVWEQGSINDFPSDRVVTVNGKPAAGWVAEIKELRRRLGVRVAVHMYQWHQTPFDTNYPDYFPIKRGFKELVADLKAGGVVVMPYINGRLYDQAAASYGPEAELNAEKTSARRVNPKTRYAWPETYGNGQMLTGMCMHSAYWHKTVVALSSRIVKELGCGGVYLDQLGCFGGRTCLDPRHGHPLGGGDYWMEGMRSMIATIRDEIGPDPLLTTECNWEACVADFDGLLDTMWNHETNLPIFPAVYWGRGAIFGGELFANTIEKGGETFVQRAGLRFVWGGQFGWGHFEPLLKKENKALWNYFAALCRLRAEYGRFFCRGEFLRPPEVTLADGTLSGNPLKGPVLSSMWGDPDGPNAAVFLVNVTRKRQRVGVRFTDARRLRLRKAAGADLAVTLEPLAVMAMPVLK